MRNVLKAKAAVDSLRCGVVNPFAAEKITCGRKEELRMLEGHIGLNPSGSVQNVIGGYGTGKSHLCELLSTRLENMGYAVAKVEMGSSHGRAENPDSFLSNIGQTIRLRHEGRPYVGESSIERLLPTRRYRPQLFSKIPTAMTAANLAVSQLNCAAHRLKRIGIKGVVLLLDEAERSNSALNSYREDRAWNLMVGLSLAAANKDTSDLKHYLNDLSDPYCPVSPSRLHVINCFTFQWGIADAISNQTGCKTLDLSPLKKGILEKVAKKVIKLYRSAYGEGASLDGPLWLKVWNHYDDEIRGFIRSILAALDKQRIYANAA